MSSDVVLDYSFGNTCAPSPSDDACSCGNRFQWPSTLEISLQKPIPNWTNLCLHLSVSHKLIEYPLQTEKSECRTTVLWLLLGLCLGAFSDDDAVHIIKIVWQAKFVNTRDDWIYPRIVPYVMHVCWANEWCKLHCTNASHHCFAFAQKLLQEVKR